MPWSGVVKNTSNIDYVFFFFSCTISRKLFFLAFTERKLCFLSTKLSQNLTIIKCFSCLCPLSVNVFQSFFFFSLEVQWFVSFLFFCKILILLWPWLGVKLMEGVFGYPSRSSITEEEMQKNGKKDKHFTPTPAPRTVKVDRREGKRRLGSQ